MTKPATPVWHYRCGHPVDSEHIRVMAETLKDSPARDDQKARAIVVHFATRPCFDCEVDDNVMAGLAEKLTRHHTCCGGAHISGGRVHNPGCLYGDRGQSATDETQPKWNMGRPVILPSPTSRPDGIGLRLVANRIRTEFGELDALGQIQDSYERGAIPAHEALDQMLTLYRCLVADSTVENMVRPALRSEYQTPPDGGTMPGPESIDPLSMSMMCRCGKIRGDHYGTNKAWCSPNIRSDQTLFVATGTAPDEGSE